MDRRRPLLPGRQGRRASEAGRARPCRARAWGPPAHRGGPRHGRRRQGRAARHAVCPRAAAGLRPRGAGGGRRDLTALPTFTIDPDTARDFDDAISVARDGEGYRAHVHIADVSYFVDDDGAIERAARRRTSSAYLPLFAEPMLPGALSSDLCSLVPRQPRKCVTAEYAFAHAGELSGAVARPETPSHALVEEFMLAANEAVAEFLLRKKARTLYRVHEPPEPASVRELLDALEELGVPTPPFPAVEAVPAAKLAEAFGRLSRTVAETSARMPRPSRAWPTLLLRALKQARYSPANLGHFGLASSAYLHFTSPIRRYPDLVTHRSLLLHLGGGGGELGEAELAAAAEDCSTREREIGRLEMEADDVALCFLLERRLQEEGWEQEFAGEVIGLVGGGLFVRFGDVFEGFLSSRRLGGERFEVSEHGTALEGQATARRYRLGDAVTVRVERVDRLRGRVDLAPAAPPAGRSVIGLDRAPARRSSGSRPPRRRGAGHDQRQRGR